MKVRAKVNVPCADSRRLRAFTMIEIAIALGVIGFALVAIIGILPLGLNVQKDNREDTIISQDGQYFMDVLRYGRQGTNSLQGTALDFLTNYVETIEIKTYSGTNFVYNSLVSDVTYGTPNSTVPPADQVLTNGHVIVGFLSTPKYSDGSFLRHDVTATVRALNGSALEQNGGNQAVAFTYQMDVTLMPYSTTPWMKYPYTNYPAGVSDVSLHTNQNQLEYLQDGLFDLGLKFSWPVFPNGTGPNRRYFQTMMSGQLLPDKSLNLPVYLFYPGAYTTNTAF